MFEDDTSQDNIPASLSYQETCFYDGVKPAVEWDDGNEAVLGKLSALETGDIEHQLRTCQ